MPDKSFTLTEELKKTFSQLGDKEAGKLIKQIAQAKENDLENVIRMQVNYWLKNNRVWERFRVAAAREREVHQWYSRLN